MVSSSSSNAPATTSTSEDTSYTMIGGDLEAIGSHCHYTYCHQLDFLPFRCGSCKYNFCLDHRTEDGHECPKKGAWAAAKRSTTSSPANASLAQKPTIQTGTQCSHPQCKTFVNTPLVTGVRCDKCRRTYCLPHRFQEDHDCANLKPLGLTPGASSAQKAQSALAKFRLWGQNKAAAAASSTAKLKPAPKPNSAAARLMALNSLKKSAKGDAKTPTEKRVYLHVEAESATTTSKLPKGEFFYSREWSVGRMLDDAAKALQVQNNNNRGGGEEERLRVFHVDKGRLLEFNEKVGQSCADGETVVLLRGIGPAIPNLIEA